jgi:hypothetical protein
MRAVQLADETRDKMVDLCCERLEMQIEAVDAEMVPRSWNIK